MNKFTAFLKNNSLIIITALFLFSLMQNCSHSSSMAKVEKQQKQSMVKIDSLLKNQISKEEMEIILEINQLEAESSTLHNMNEIVLKNIRPDQRIYVIDQRIKVLEEKLK